MKDLSQLSPSTKLLTILNVAAAKPKRARQGRDWHAIVKKARIATESAAFASTSERTLDEDLLIHDQSALENGSISVENTHTKEYDEQDDLYEKHWGVETKLLPWIEASDAANPKWKKSSRTLGGWGNFLEYRNNADVEEVEVTEADLRRHYNAKLMKNFRNSSNGVSQNKTVDAMPTKLLEFLASYRDFYYTKTNPINHGTLRSVSALHAMNHVLKTRARVLKTNEKISKLSEDASSESITTTADQGFTRPKVLILLPFRNSASKWVNLLTSLSSVETVENKARFDAEFDLPEGAVDKIAKNIGGQYPDDHVETFKGNIDDSFRIGLKMTRKTVKLFSEFYSSDIILASPVGLRTSIEKDGGDSDFLSSIEILIVDQMDVMTMQNWDHVQFVMERLNKLPEESHGCDFSRVKPWYLDGKAAFLRQSILLSNYETPEMRSIFNKNLLNTAGKLKAEAQYEGVLTSVPKGIKQVFTRFEAVDLYHEDDARFEHFTTKTLPFLLKSAVSSSKTVIFVPSYFDFVRLKRYLKKLESFSFTSISEYTPTPEISRARQAFFSGEKKFLLVTERFHFFRRYRIRGSQTFVFYAPPEHAHYYPEILSSPFNKAADELQVDESEVSCQVIFSKFDLLRLERICGSADARRMVTAGAEATKFNYL